MKRGPKTSPRTIRSGTIASAAAKKGDANVRGTKLPNGGAPRRGKASGRAMS